MKTKTPAWRSLLLPGFFFCLWSPAFSGPSAPVQAQLYVSFVDHVPPPRDGTLIGLDKEQRNAAFRAALQTAADAGELPPVVVVNGDGALRTGATRLRVYLKQWSNTRYDGFTDTDIVCRFDAEIMRGDRPVIRLGPYTGATNFDPTTMTAAENRSVIFREAARRAIAEMARALPR